jgi:hypothetical protein
MNAQRTLLWLAFSGAILAACGDGMLLLLGNGNLALSLSAFSSLVLIGSLAGVIGIALYSFGYQGRAEQVRSRHPRAAAWLTFCGALFASTGAAVHCATGLSIAFSSPRAGQNPYSAILNAGPLLVSMWAVAAFFFFGVVLADLASCSN